MFVWKVSSILAEFERQMPGLYALLVELEQAAGTPGYAGVLERVWPQVELQTIDYGIMEHARQVAVIPVEIGWTDIGSWGSLLDILPSEEDGNIWVGPHLGLETRNCLVFGGKRMVVTLGVQDLVIVDTADALLVMSKAYEQQVKKVVEALKAEGQKDLV